jgi:hypothetical protein
MNSAMYITFARQDKQLIKRIDNPYYHSVEKPFDLLFATGPMCPSSVGNFTNQQKWKSVFEKNSGRSEKDDCVEECLTNSLSVR